MMQKRRKKFMRRFGKFEKKAEIFTFFVKTVFFHGKNW